MENDALHSGDTTIKRTYFLSMVENAFNILKYFQLNLIYYIKML